MTAQIAEEWHPQHVKSSGRIYGDKDSRKADWAWVLLYWEQLVTGGHNGRPKLNREIRRIF